MELKVEALCSGVDPSSSPLLYFTDLGLYRLQSPDHSQHTQLNKKIQTKDLNLADVHGIKIF